MAIAKKIAGVVGIIDKPTATSTMRLLKTNKLRRAAGAVALLRSAVDQALPHRNAAIAVE